MKVQRMVKYNPVYKRSNYFVNLIASFYNKYVKNKKKKSDTLVIKKMKSNIGVSASFG